MRSQFESSTGIRSDSDLAYLAARGLNCPSAYFLGNLGEEVIEKLSQYVSDYAKALVRPRTSASLSLESKM